MKCNLDAIEQDCLRLSLPFSRVSPARIEIAIEPQALLLFWNQPHEPDTIVGFKNTPWHFHGSLVVMGGDSEFVEFPLGELLPSIVDGTLLICERFARGNLQDQWLIHRNEPLSLRYMEAGEEIRIRSYKPAAQQKMG